MLQEIMEPAVSGELLIEEISSPIAALQLHDFCDDDEVAGGGAGDLFCRSGNSIRLPSVSSSAARNAVANGQEALCCYGVDSAAATAFSFFPSLYALLDVLPPPPDPEPDLSVYPSSVNLLPSPPSAVMFQVPPESAMYVGDSFDHMMLKETITDGYSLNPSMVAGESSIGQQPQHLYEEPGYAPPEMVGLNAPSFELLESINATLYGGADTQRFFGGVTPPVGPTARLLAESGAPVGSFGHEALQHRLFGSGDFQKVIGGCSSGSIASSDDPTYKVGRLSVEERKEKIHRYMKKRNERNFSKKIKIAGLECVGDSRRTTNWERRPSANEFDDDEEVKLIATTLANKFSGVNSFRI
ncbi:hypothetical protein ZIOFF_048183 [Zingiber officinale]|uniref:CCT domain-containing protein n=1 Tax=Zingiber officinale TaxID=94328 RepID=A0A8J5FYS7_ZINOF|nr:hypothetical protein ZIOFF_048183 [Zingiber officinale]